MSCIRPPYRIQQKVCVSSQGRSHTAIKYALPANKGDQGTVTRKTSINKVTTVPAQLIHNWNRIA